jgi:hypothetical protein
VKIELSCLPQETDSSCLPACIRIVLRYLGCDLSEIEIDVDTFLAAWDEPGRLGLVIEPS